jgi:hypothetical protein
MRVAPAPGLVIRDPVTKLFVPPEGIEVAESDLFWVRRINDGDAVIVPPAAAPSPLSVVPEPLPAPMPEPDEEKA